MHSSQQRILAVDDETRYRGLMRVNLEAAGYRFVGVTSGQKAIDLLSRQVFDLAIFDVRMPGMDGFTLIRIVREFSDMPIIFVTALGEESNKVEGLKGGADDYLTKPYGAPELLARIEAVLRRYQGASRGRTAQVALDDLRIDLVQHRVFRDGVEVLLSRTEYRLLAGLVRYTGKVVPQDQLVRDVWGPTYEADFEGLRVYIHRLRHKLETDPDAPRHLVTFPGVGYMLKAASGLRRSAV
ncbi:MAG TPA: response regulator transcription factor [Chloroflexota bacterium]